MNRSQPLRQSQDGLPSRAVPRWFATLADSAPANRADYECVSVASDPRARHLFLGREIGSSFPICATGNDSAVVLDGALYNRQELETELGKILCHGISNDAELILAGYQRWGERVFQRLRGVFALIVWDKSSDILFCLRDPLGTYPLFYAEVASGLVLSTSIEVLLQHPHVSRAVNRAALADYFVDRFPRLEETYLEAVKRVPPGHVLCAARQTRRSYRYWDPAPNGTISWLTADEVEKFDEVLDRAVSRCLSFGPAAIFLSGGLDSVSVAAAALDQTRTQGLPNPTALSLVFPQPEMSEEVVQRSVATQLGLPHVVKPFYEAIGKGQLLEPAIELSASLPAPLMNTWLPAFYGLGLEAKRRGCGTILTGNGGDEWLTISPYLAADLLRSLNFRGLYRLAQNLRRSHRRSMLALMRVVLWRFGAQPLVVPPIHRFAKQVAPWSIRLRHRLFPDLPHWLAPDPELRQELKRRREEYAVEKAKLSDRSFYLREARKALDHPVISAEMEEYFNVYQRAGLRLLHPFWDADLVELLYRTPPFMLDRDGRNKGLVRSCLQSKFPQLGFERQVKLEATNFYISSVHNEGESIWRRLAGANTLADMGIVDRNGVRQFVEHLLIRGKHGMHAHRAWSVLNLEAWVRAHA